MLSPIFFAFPFVCQVHGRLGKFYSLLNSVCYIPNLYLVPLLLHGFGNLLLYVAASFLSSVCR